MLRLCLQFLCAVAVSAAITGCKEDPEFAKAAASMTQANAVIYDLSTNNHQQLKARLSDQVSADEAVKQLSEEWAALVQDLGTFKKIETVQTHDSPEFQTIAVRCEFEKGAAIAVVGLDAAGSVRHVEFEKVNG